MFGRGSLRGRGKLALAALAAGLGGTALIPAGAAAHGASEEPPARTLQCRGDVASPMCAQAWNANPQAIYDWMEVNIGDAAGRHRELVPDGELCSAGRDKFAAFDEPGPWKAASLTPNAQGNYDVRFRATAPHATAYFRWYITDQGFDPATDRLGWDDLTLVQDSGSAPSEAFPEFELDLQGRTGNHILYMVWQRSDSPEAFYGCSDVLLGDSQPDPDPDPDPGPDPDPDPDPDPGPDPDPDPDPPTGPQLEARIEIDDDWGAGYCATGTVTNEGTETIAWESIIDPGGAVATGWNGIFTSQHVHGAGDTHPVRVVGADWNRMLGAGQSTSFGFCADRQAGGGPEPAPDPEPPAQDVSIDLTRTADWGAGYCADATVTNRTGSELKWEGSLADPGQISSIWNAVQEPRADGVSVSGAAWNRTLPPGGTTTFGFCATS